MKWSEFFLLEKDNLLCKIGLHKFEPRYLLKKDVPCQIGWPKWKSKGLPGKGGRRLILVCQRILCGVLK